MAAQTAKGVKFQTGHIGLNVTDLSRSKEFYQTIFGFGVILESQAEGRRFVFLGEGDNIVLTLWEQSKGRFEAQRPGLHHLSFQLETMEKVKETEQRLRARNVRMLYEGIVPHAEGMDSGGVFFEDPDGIRLEIYALTGARERPAPVAGAPT